MRVKCQYKMTNQALQNVIQYVQDVHITPKIKDLV